MDHGAKKPRKRALWLAMFREKLDDDDRSPRGQGVQTLLQNLAARLLLVIVENMAKKHGIIRTAKCRRAQIASQCLHGLRNPKLGGKLLGDR
jgi:hypothetical protein